MVVFVLKTAIREVFAFLADTGWRKTLRFLPGPELPSNAVGLLHALVTGVWTHIVTLIPWHVRTGAKKWRELEPADPDSGLHFNFSQWWSSARTGRAVSGRTARSTRRSRG